MGLVLLGVLLWFGGLAGRELGYSLGVGFGLRLVRGLTGAREGESLDTSDFGASI